MLFSTDILLKLALSIVIGGIIGIEREYNNKSAGFRTMILISLGSTLFTIISMEIGNTESPDRIASNIVTGIGFVGAGVIFKGDTGVAGITTAATIWVTAALGMGIAAGYEWIAIAGCLLLLPILYAFTFFENWLTHLNQMHIYKLVCTYDPNVIGHYEQLFKKHKLRYSNGIFRKEGDHFTAIWNVQGAEKNHQQAIRHILNDPGVESFEF